MRVDCQGALYPVEKYDLDGVPHCGPQNGPQIAQIGIVRRPLLCSTSWASLDG